MQSLNGDCDNIPAHANSASILKTSHHYGCRLHECMSILTETERIDLVAEGFYGPPAVHELKLSIPFHAVFHSLLQRVLRFAGSQKLILKYVFSPVCTNLSWIVFREVSLWFKSVLFHCNEEWSSSYPQFQLLMRIHGMTNRKPLSFKQQIKKIQIN